ncbi:MAG: hypothetical protein Q4C71_05075 [Microbacteriaceae bacterium]|nr:hypothetical protein [Microbacteriaceae bacterium]
MKASIAQQQLLLKLAEIDTRVARARRALTELPQEKALQELDKTAQPLRAALLVAQRDAEGVQDEMRRLQSDLEMVEARSKRNAELLANATDSSLAGSLSAEEASLKRRAEKLETSQLELMENEERTSAALANAEKDLAAIDEKRAALVAEMQADKAKLEAELADILAERDGQAAEITGDLLAEYEQIRAHSGIGAARIYRGVSEASNMKLSPGELATINETAPDELVYCPLTGAILVRVPEDE